MLTKINDNDFNKLLDLATIKAKNVILELENEKLKTNIYIDKKINSKL